MFIIEPIKKEDSKGELKLLYRMIERSLGFVPPHFELFATIDLKAMVEFVEYNQYIMKHEKIDSDLLPYLRLCIAKKECRNYCVNFNYMLLKNMNISEQLINNIEDEIHNLPFNKEHKTILIKVLKANKFTKTDLDELKDLGFSDKDFFDLLSYATNFMGKSKMIEAYLKWE